MPGRAYVNGATGMCLAIGQGAGRKGRAAIQWPCGIAAEQAWRR
ncbi:RICIN domain-containing protein [Nonomuraea sp. NPDC050783]